MSDWKEPPKSIKVAIDPLIINGNKIILLKRKIEPFKNKLEFPGGMVKYGETVEHAIVREAEEETGLKVKVKNILGVYSHPKRDSRFHTVSVAFVTAPVGGKLKSSFEGKADWYDINKINFKGLGFDHAKILKDYLKWKKKKGTYWSTK